MRDSESCFFFQAEDGIRDLVRSRGLGDVYKRQGRGGAGRSGHQLHLQSADLARRPRGAAPVSYTHLTLPTSDLVEISVVAVSLKKKRTNEAREDASGELFRVRTLCDAEMQ